MTSNAERRVVSINAVAGDRGPGLRIVADCTDRLSDALCGWLASARTTIGEELLLLADGTRERELQKRYLDLRHDVERDWTQFIESVRRRLTEPTGARNRSQEEALDTPDFEGLQLVDDTALSEHIVIREFAARLAERCDEELYPLTRRIAALLGREEPEDDGGPLAPQAIVQALVDAAADIGLDGENRLLLIRRLERHLSDALTDLYQPLNSDLSERGILPDLKRSFRQHRPAKPAASIDQLAQQAAAAAETPAGILDTLQRLVAARVGAPLLDGSAPPTVGTMPGSQQPSPGSISHAFLTSLNEAQHTEWQPAAGVALNRVSAMRDAGVATQASPIEAVTIDIVAMLFDFIFNDEELPDAVKLLVGQLQIPVLKVAMLDQSFFANRQHPARRFLDGITGVALHWGSDGREDDPFNARLAALVAQIQREFETDVEVFSKAITELELFVTDYEAEEAEIAQIAAEAATQRESEEAADERARAALEQVMERAQPEVVRAFIDEHWTAVLRQIALKPSSDERAWQDAVEIAEQLVWSVGAKQGTEERMRLIGTLPMLLGRLNAGLSTINIDREARSAFFDALVALHATALKGAKAAAPTKTSPLARGTASESSPERRSEVVGGSLRVTRRVEEGVTIEDVSLIGRPKLRRARDREALAEVDALQRGDWVEFIDAEGRVTRERLNWLSPQKRILVFSNHRAAKAISISPEALALQLSTGSARIPAAEATVFGRAIDGVMHSLGAA